MLPAFHDRKSAVQSKKRQLFSIPRLVAVMTLLALAFFARSRGFSAFKFKSCHRTLTKSSLPTHFTLPSGDKIPSVALGVWQAAPGQVGNAVKTALNAGYRHIDDAWIYRNEEEVGVALEQSGVPREDIWLTSKLWNFHHHPDTVESALDESLSKLRTSYLDLYLIHWPLALNKDGSVYDKDLTDDPYPTWKKLEEMVEKGKVKNIGLSNFNIRRIQNLTANPLKIKPAVNQVEINYFFPQTEMISWAKDNDIVIEAYSPLGSDRRVKDTLNIPEVKEIAADLGITPAQVIISWHVQRGTVVLPKSVTAHRIEENFQTVTLPPASFKKLEDAANAHPPKRGMNPSKGWGLDFDIFE
ncbi:NADP-dependent oxidoreductase domain-containing protein [Mycena floridula]|nr:NADP-dependent oxidoreductase domain-containing protein [Mycena floridula]